MPPSTMLLLSAAAAILLASCAEACDKSTVDRRCPARRRRACQAPKPGCKHAPATYAINDFNGMCCQNNHCQMICPNTECKNAKRGDKCKTCKGSTCACQDDQTTLGHALTCMAAKSPPSPPAACNPSCTNGFMPFDAKTHCINSGCGGCKGCAELQKTCQSIRCHGNAPDCKFGKCYARKKTTTVAPKTTVKQDKCTGKGDLIWWGCGPNDCQQKICGKDDPGICMGVCQARCACPQGLYLAAKGGTKCVQKNQCGAVTTAAPTTAKPAGSCGYNPNGNRAWCRGSCGNTKATTAKECDRNNQFKCCAWTGGGVATTKATTVVQTTVTPAPTPAPTKPPTTTATTITTTKTTTTATATTTTQRVCGPGEKWLKSRNLCVACGTGYRSESSHVMQECAPWAARCAANEFQTAAPTASSNRKCSGLSECSEDQFESKSPAQTGGDRECTALTTCLPGSQVYKASTAKADRTCRDCKPGFFSLSDNEGGCTEKTFCSEDEFATLVDDRSADVVCEACPEGEHLDLRKHQETACLAITTTTTTTTTTETVTTTTTPLVVSITFDLDYDTTDMTFLNATLRTELGNVGVTDADTVPITYRSGSVIADVTTDAAGAVVLSRAGGMMKLVSAVTTAVNDNAAAGAGDDGADDDAAVEAEAAEAAAVAAAPEVKQAKVALAKAESSLGAAGCGSKTTPKCRKLGKAVAKASASYKAAASKAKAAFVAEALKATTGASATLAAAVTTGDPDASKSDAKGGDAGTIVVVIVGVLLLVVAGVVGAAAYFKKQAEGTSNGAFEQGGTQAAMAFSNPHYEQPPQDHQDTLLNQHAFHPQAPNAPPAANQPGFGDEDV